MPPPDLKITLPDGFSFDLMYVEGGEFDMGGDEYDDERPIHRVKVSSFYMGKYQVTQRLWETVMDGNPSNFKGENRPVETVSWLDAQKFIKKLNKETDKPTGLSGQAFRLPTEAEWEYVARGGIYSQGYTYAGSDRLKQVGWYNENSTNETHDVGLLLANELGIHDLSGNVYEWCEDWFDEKYYKQCKKKGLEEDPSGADRGVFRMARGGSYFDSALPCRPTHRDRGMPGDRGYFTGFRLCLPFQSVEKPTTFSWTKKFFKVENPSGNHKHKA